MEIAMASNKKSLNQSEIKHRLEELATAYTEALGCNQAPNKPSRKLSQILIKHLIPGYQNLYSATEMKSELKEIMRSISNSLNSWIIHSLRAQLESVKAPYIHMNELQDLVNKTAKDSLEIPLRHFILKYEYDGKGRLVFRGDVAPFITENIIQFGLKRRFIKDIGSLFLEIKPTKPIEVPKYNELTLEKRLRLQGLEDPEEDYNNEMALMNLTLGNPQNQDDVDLRVYGMIKAAEALEPLKGKSDRTYLTSQSAIIKEEAWVIASKGEIQPD